MGNHQAPLTEFWLQTNVVAVDFMDIPVGQDLVPQCVVICIM
jgi:hypothetical protein